MMAAAEEEAEGVQGDEEEEAHICEDLHPFF